MRKNLLTWLCGLILFTSAHLNAQCPSGSVTNTAGTYGAGQKVCITLNFSGNITLNSGAIMTVINGGNYTGSLRVNAGGVVTVQTGGRLAASGYANYAGTINNDGTAVMSGMDIVAGGATLNNNSVMTWPSNWNQNAQINITNTGCGYIAFTPGMTVGNNATIVNNGRLNFLGQLTMHAGTSLVNRGSLYVSGTITTAGLLYNYYKAVFKGGGNNLNAGDSMVNLGWMVFSGSVTSGRPIRNEGLLQNGGTWTNNSGGTVRVNNTNAQFRVGGSLNNNALLQGNGSLYVNGSVTNNNTISGLSVTQRLEVNKVLNPASAPNTTYNPAMVAFDTNSYAAAMAQPAVCGGVLPKMVSGLQAAYSPGQSKLNWNAGSASSEEKYYVEFSADGEHFITVCELAGGAINYQFAHHTNAAGYLYYRVRELMSDGKTVYSNVVIVKTATQITTDIFPNPFTNNLQVNIYLDKNDVIEVALLNAGGQMIIRQQRAGQAGNNAITVSGLSSLTPGVYFARITTGNKTVYSKLIR